MNKETLFFMEAGSEKNAPKGSFLSSLCKHAGGTLTCTEDGNMREFNITLGLV
jgi:hypothetical protein